MSGLQDIPIRWPAEYDPKFMEVIFRDVLQFADVRNAVEGIGISVSGNSDEVATISNSAAQASYIVLGANAELANERILGVESDVLTLTDNGAGLTVVVAVAVNGVTFAKLQQIPTASFMGRATASTGDVETLTATQATALLNAATELLKGTIELATLAEVVTGTDTERAVTAAGLTERQQKPSTIGSATPNTGKFTTLEATGETFLNLPTAATGTSGSLWNDAGTVKVVP